MKPIDRSEYEKRRARISDIFTKIAKNAERQVQMRCPYKNRLDQCTAKFGCAYKRKPRRDEQFPACSSDDKLDYRSAWEMDPEAYEKMRCTIKAESSGNRPRQPVATATVTHDGQSVAAETGKTIFDYADELSVRVPTSCGRSGHCHECIVEIKRGMDALSPPSETETFLRPPYRLACQAILQQANQHLEFGLLRRSPQILTAQPSPSLDLDPPISRRGDAVFYEGEQIDQHREHVYGIAVDVGTTTVVAELVDLESGQSIFTSSFENPQRFAGSDVMNRISYDAGEFRGEMHNAIINALNEEIRDLCRNLEITRHEIYEIVVVGNSTMRDLFFNLDVQSIGQKPYKSIIENEMLDGKRHTTSLCELARKLRIYANRNARVFGAPLIASHVGADVTADLVAINMLEQNEVVMMVDAGTNTEVIIGHKNQLMAASCPAGPAFEGGLVRCGMPGCEGAVESIRYAGDHFDFQTIGQVPPSGICGSGLIDLLAELRRHDLMSPKGVFAGKTMELSIIPEHAITFSREDASHLAQAKAANYCGQMILMRYFGVQPADIKRLYLAGGFANYVDPANAVEIGFLSPVPLERIVKAGNAAMQGAREMLLSQQKRRAIEKLIRSIEHVELETMPDFFDAFVEGCQFKPMVFEDIRKS